MNVGILFAFLLVLVISFVIAAKSRVVSIYQNTETFLFGGNNSFLAISSNVGSLLSVSIIFSMFSVGIIGYGVMTLVATLLGILAAYIVLQMSRRRISDSYGDLINRRLLLQNVHGRFERHLPLIIVTQYFLAITLEFAVFQNLLSPLNTEIAHASLYLGFIVALLCSAYVIIGGYAGVLRTDLFQMIVFGIGIGVLIFSIANGPTNSLSAFTASGFWSFAPLIGSITWFTFTFAVFLAFPDVWIRVFGTLDSKQFCTRTFFPLSFILLSLALLPILYLSAQAAKDIGVFDFRYDVQRCYDFFVNQFVELEVGPLGRIFIVCSFLAMFVTTIDTWLIGIAQHVSRFRRKKRGSALILWVFTASIMAVSLSSLMDGRAIFMIGLHLFPFIYFNSLLFLVNVFDFFEKDRMSGVLITGLIVGLVVTFFQITSYGSRAEEHAPDIIFWAMIAQISTFSVGLSLFKIQKKWN